MLFKTIIFYFIYLLFFCEIERSVLGVWSLKNPRFFFLFLRNLADCLIFLREETANWPAKDHKSTPLPHLPPLSPQGWYFGFLENWKGELKEERACEAGARVSLRALLYAPTS